MSLTLVALSARVPYFSCLSPSLSLPLFFLFFFNDTATTEIYTLSLHDALPISSTSTHESRPKATRAREWLARPVEIARSEEHTSELQSLRHLVCRLLLEKKKKKIIRR